MVIMSVPLIKALAFEVIFALTEANVLCPQ